MKSVKKGKLFEKNTILYLQNRGFLTERKPSLHWQSYSKDLFGIFDVYAIGNKDQQDKLIQCKVNSCANNVYRELQSFVLDRGKSCNSYEVWLYLENYDIVTTVEYTLEDKLKINGNEIKKFYKVCIEKNG